MSVGIVPSLPRGPLAGTRSHLVHRRQNPLVQGLRAMNSGPLVLAREQQPLPSLSAGPSERSPCHMSVEVGWLP